MKLILPHLPVDQMSQAQQDFLEAERLQLEAERRAEGVDLQRSTTAVMAGLKEASARVLGPAAVAAENSYVASTSKTEAPLQAESVTREAHSGSSPIGGAGEHENGASPEASSSPATASSSPAAAPASTSHGDTPVEGFDAKKGRCV
jgi:hypothetical protein